MAKFLLVCARDNAGIRDERVRRACSILMPDNIPAQEPHIRTGPGITLAVVGPAASLPLKDLSVCLGAMIGNDQRWWAPGTPTPDGSYLLARCDDSTVELVSDAVASRSAFYCCTDSLFVASSSQVAVVAILGSFQPNPETVSWMISSGTTGPGLSWDDRITRIGPDTRVTLDRAVWKLTTVSQPIVFSPERWRKRQHKQQLREAVFDVCEQLDLEGGAWCLPLSGGHDSRALLLCLAQKHKELRCITWGLDSSLDDPQNDAAVAQRLARFVGVPHEYYPLDSGNAGDLNLILDRFLKNGDGCVENIGGYTDGFEMWRRLYSRGLHGLVRGDEGFGWEAVACESAVRNSLRATMLTDVLSMEQLARLGLAEQRWPDYLSRCPSESLETWRDRLYHAYRIPFVLASLTDLKTIYLEVINPFLSRRVLNVVRVLSDRERTDKRLFRELVTSFSPPIPFAVRPAIPEQKAIIGSTEMLGLARAELDTARKEGLLPSGLVDYLLKTLPETPHPQQTAQRYKNGQLWRTCKPLARAIPNRILMSTRLGRRGPPSTAVLAFRAVIASRMGRRLALAADV